MPRRGGPGTEPCALLVRKDGAPGAKCCPGGATAVQFIQMMFISVVVSSGASKNLKAVADHHLSKLINVQISVILFYLFFFCFIVCMLFFSVNETKPFKELGGKTD